MRTINPHPHLLNHPVRLTEAEKQNPHLVLQDFFSCFHLHDTREILWEWLSAALSTESGEYDTGYSRGKLLFVYEKLELLIEAAYQIDKRNKKRQKRSGRKYARHKRLVKTN